MTEREDSARTRVRTVLEQRVGIGPGQYDETPSGVCFRLISARMCVLVHETAPGRVFVKLQGSVGKDVPLSHELNAYVAAHGGDWLYGHLNAIPDEGGSTCTVVFRHVLADRDLTDDSLEEAIRSFAGTLEELDDRVVATFGGRRSYEEE